MRAVLFSVALCAVASAGMARADPPKVVPVVFAVTDNDWRDRNLMESIREALSRTPSFNLMAKITPEALVITVPDGFGRDGHEDNASYSFMAMFFRNGEKIGESQEGCKAKALSDCANQIAADAQSAANVVK